MNFLSKYKGQPIPPPKKGIIVKSSYLERAEEGTYELWDIANKTMIKAESYYSLIASDNLISLTGITDAVCYCVSENLTLEIYSVNDVGVKWARKCKGKQTKKDERAASMFADCLAFLKKAGYGAFIKHWSPRWGDPKKLFK